MPDGTRDHTFGSRGIITADYGDTDIALARCCLLSGDLVVIGIHSQPHGNYEGYLATFAADGKPHGVTFFDPIADTREAVTRVVPVDGGYILGGYAYDPSRKDSGVFVAKLHTDGTLNEASAHVARHSWRRPRMGQEQGGIVVTRARAARHHLARWRYGHRGLALVYCPVHRRRSGRQDVGPPRHRVEPDG